MQHASTEFEQFVDSAVFVRVFRNVVQRFG
jgi:hypothetical protein